MSIFDQLTFSVDGGFVDEHGKMDSDKWLTWSASSSLQPVRAKTMVFRDPASQALLRHIERIALSDATVLVTGETGTGKELIVRHLHACSGRKGPFIAVNCGAFSESLIDAELFGHESGAFTGALQARAGWFEAAHGGTLFLDEVGELPLALQVKLLRVLQERQVVRVGSRRAIALDVRLVAAANIDLAGAVATQRFRADLYYRLNVAGVKLPPLRERPGDILPLVRHFISLYRQRLELPEVRLSPGAQDALLRHGWPGNIRELENTIHYALIVCRDHVINVGDIRLLPLRVHRHPSDATREGGASQGRPGDVAGLDGLHQAVQSLLQAGQNNLFDRVESALVHSAYAHARKNQVHAARLLGITRNMLRTQLKRHGVIGRDGLNPVDEIGREAPLA